MEYAIVDIGSNAIKYKIFDIDLKLVEYYRHPLRLGRDVFTKGYLEEKTIENLLNLLLEYSKIFKKNNIKSVNYIATSALRDTNNSSEILTLLEKHNLNIKIISGDVEASLLAEFNKTKTDTAVIDIGGGSLEICINSNDEIHSKSFQLGAVRLINFDELQKTQALKELRSWLNQFKPINHLYGLGGNLRALMQVNQINGPMDTSNFNDYVKKYLSMNNSTLLNDYKIPADRIDIIPEALNLYGLIIKELQSKTIENTFWSISDGMVRKILKNQL